MNVRNGKKNHQCCMWLRAGSLVNRGDSERQREIQNRWKMLAGSMQGTSIIKKWGKVIQEMETIWSVWMPIVQILIRIRAKKGLPRWHSGKESACQCRRCKRCRFYPWVKKILWSRKWQPTPVLLPGNPMDREAWQPTVHGVTESDTTEHAHIRATKICSNI